MAIDRRAFVLGSAALAACTGYPSESRRARADFRGLQRSLGPSGRLGVAALDTGSGRWLVHDETSLYAMASTFKVALAGAILAEAGRGALSLDDEVPFSRADLVPYAPVIEANMERGRLPVARLCAAIVEVSDNVAANLLLARIGGPEGLTRFIRRCGDAVTRLDRTEPSLNANLPGDPRDTTSPAAMVGLLSALLFGDALHQDSRTRLAGWMEAATTGRARLRAGLPAGWRVGDKTGNGAGGAANDIAFAVPPGRRPILIACYQSGGNADLAARDAIHAAVARAVAAAFL
ncbi:MAG: beta-lactamase class [Sphingomonadales bacterium]|jgi:beta-lactamase class A|nr:beta-lactamase class [Sphingomonadales bacterium]